MYIKKVVIVFIILLGFNNVSANPPTFEQFTEMFNQNFKIGDNNGQSSMLSLEEFLKKIVYYSSDQAKKIKNDYLYVSYSNRVIGVSVFVTVTGVILIINHQILGKILKERGYQRFLDDISVILELGTPYITKKTKDDPTTVLVRSSIGWIQGRNAISTRNLMDVYNYLLDEPKNVKALSRHQPAATIRKIKARKKVLKKGPIPSKKIPHFFTPSISPGAMQQFVTTQPNVDLARPSDPAVNMFFPLVPMAPLPIQYNYCVCPWCGSKKFITSLDSNGNQYQCLNCNKLYYSKIPVVRIHRTGEPLCPYCFYPVILNLFTDSSYDTCGHCYMAFYQAYFDENYARFINRE